MEELSLEEKAQRYDEAIEKLRSLHDDYDNVSTLIDIKEELENIFPELASEDERIRKEIIDFATKANNVVTSILANNYDFNKWLAWLEKQASPVLSNSSNTGKPFNYENSNIQQKDFAPKVEPKFKVGDWITNGIETIQITGYDIDYGYQVDYKGNLQHRDTDVIEKEYHLWSIQDAKDGDVLVTDKSVFIYAKVLYSKPYAYCGIDKFGVFKDNCLEHDWANSVDNIHPATKEQRDLLFQKMKEAGYEWDAGKKKLELLITNGGDFESENCEENPAWSEEDEHWRQKAIDFMKHPDWIKTTPTLVKDTISWLKSLKPNKQWKPTKEQMDALWRRIAEIKISDERPSDIYILGELYEQLENL